MIVVEIDFLEAAVPPVVHQEGVAQDAAVLEGQVIELVLHIEPDLPVGALAHQIGLHQLHLVERAAVELVGDPAKICPQGLRRLRVQMDEDEALPEVRVYRREPVVALVEVEEVLLVRHADQLARVAVHPIVEVAVDAAGA